MAAVEFPKSPNPPSRPSRRQLSDPLRRWVRDLRLTRPWSYKAPFLISVPYAVMRLGDVSLWNALTGILAAATTIAGVAGIAYLLNDLADREADRVAGKANFFLLHPSSSAGALGVGFLGLAIAPWLLVLPLTPWTGSLLLLELLSFAAYSLPPLRLKDRAFLGALTDATYAHVNPAVLAALAFAPIAAVLPEDLLPLLAWLASWQFALGLRNILLHQVVDLANDRKSGTRTWAAGLRSDAGERILRALVATELVLFAGYAATISRFVDTLVPGLLAFAAFTIWRVRFRTDRTESDGLRRLLFIWVDDLYVEWVPLIVLADFIPDDPTFVLLFLLHVVIFPKNAVARIATLR